MQTFKDSYWGGALTLISERAFLKHRYSGMGLYRGGVVVVLAFPVHCYGPFGVGTNFPIKVIASGRFPGARGWFAPSVPTQLEPYLYCFRKR